MSYKRPPLATGKSREKIDMQSWQRYLWAFDELIKATNASDQRRMRMARAIMYHELWREPPGGRS